jgi:hypothetical protein
MKGVGDMKPTPQRSVSLLSALLMFPALFLSICGGLFLAGLTSANDLIASVLATLAGRLLLSPVGVFGGLLLSLVLNLRALCRLRIGLDGSAVYLTLWIARAPYHVILSALAVLLIALLLAYAFVENFSVLAR